MNIIFLAPPAAGKGTLSLELKKKYGYNHISAGDVLREEVKSGSELGNEIKLVIDKGELVNNDLMKRLMFNKLKTLDKQKGFIFDGYPRTLDQITDYKKICNELNIDEGYGVYINVDKDLALKRALGRMTCPTCKRGYNKYFDEFKPKNDNLCDDCNQLLMLRTDDNEESFLKRFNTYINETEEVIRVLKAEKKLIELNGNKESLEVFLELEKFLRNNK